MKHRSWLAVEAVATAKTSAAKQLLMLQYDIVVDYTKNGSVLSWESWSIECHIFVCTINLFTFKNSTFNTWVLSKKKYLGASIPSSTPLQHKLSMDIDRKLAWVCTYFKLLRPHRSTIALPSVLALAALVLLDAAMHVFAARNRKHWGDQMKMERKTGHWNEEKQRTRDCRLGKGNSQERRCAGAGCCWMWSR